MKMLVIAVPITFYLQHQVVKGESDWSYSIKTGVSSEYIARIGSILDTSPISINEISISYKGWYAGIWSSTDLGGKSYGKNYGDEFDPYIGWTRYFHGIRFDLSSTYYAISLLDRMDDDLWVIEPEISIPECPFVEPYIRVRYFGKVGSQSPEGGMFYFGGIKKHIPLGIDICGRAATLSLDASTAFAGGALHDYTGFVYGRLTTSFDIPLSKHLTLNPLLIYQVAAPGQRSNPQGFTDGNKLVGMITLGYTF